MSRNKNNWDFLVNADGQYDAGAGQKGQKGAPGGQKGLKGAAGQKGATGADGTNGADGDKGQKGGVGIGQKGATGTGDKGNKGASGAASAKGDKGLTGLKGNQGDKGLTGAGTKGIQGDKGINGGPGAKGLKGSDGATAQKGNTGTAGTKGLTGAKGITGAKGLPGAASSKGQKGADGLKGLKGTKGVEVKGQKGQDGTKGTAAALLDFKGGVASIGNLPAQPQPAGDTYLVLDENVYYSSNGSVWTAQGAVLKGEKGLKGQKGLGDKGQKGVDGAKGVNGTKGLKGGDGVAGPKGLTGAKGINGVKGLKGEDIKGQKGIKGFKGAPAPLLDFKGDVPSLVNLPTQPQPAGDTYLVVDESLYYTSDGAAWNASGTVVKGQKGQKGSDDGGVAGTNTQVQFNDSGVFGSSANLVFNDATNTLGTTSISAVNVNTSGTLNSLDSTVLGSGTSNTITPNGRFDAGLVPTTTDTIDVGTSALRWRNVYVQALRAGGVLFPITDGTNGEVLTTNGSGIADWGPVTGAASNTEVLYNNSGATAGDGRFTWDQNTGTLDVTTQTVATLDVSGPFTASASVVLGNQPTDTIQAVGRFSSDLVPLVSNSKNLGTAALPWNNAFLGGLRVGNTTYPQNDGSAGQILATDGSGNISFITNTATAGGSDTQIQFNNSGSLGGSSAFIFDAGTATVTATNFTVSAALTAAGIAFPVADGTAGQILATDGAGNLDFVTNSATPAGSTTEIQFNNAGSLDADADLTYNTASNTLTTSTVNADLIATTIEVSSVAELNGGAVVGTSASQSLILNARIGGDLIPSSNSFDIGSAAAVYAEGHITALFAGGVAYPTADGTTGQVLVTDGAGNLDFATNTPVPAGGNQQIQFNNGGLLDASLSLTFNDGTDTLTTPNIVSSDIDTQTLTVTGLSSLASATFSRDVTFGTANNDNVTFNSRVASSIDPGNANVYNLGAAGLEWNEAHINTLIAGDVTYPTADGTAGQILETDGAGNLDFVTPAISTGGTWTAELTGDLGNPASRATATGYWTRQGDLVMVQATFSNINTTGYSGTVFINGLPVASKATSTQRFIGTVYEESMFSTSVAPPMVTVVPSSTSMNFVSNDDGDFSTGRLTWGTVGTGRFLSFQVSYLAA